MKHKFSVGDEVIIIDPTCPQLCGIFCIITEIDDCGDYTLHHPTKNWSGYYTSGFYDEHLRLATPLDKLL